MSEKIVRVGRSVVGLLLTFLVALMFPVVARADDRPTNLETQVSAWVDGTVEVSGQLVDVGGTAVPGAPVVVSVGGERVGTGTTDGSGSFQVSFTMPAQFRNGSPQVDVTYAGDGTFAATTDARKVEYGGQQLGLTGNPGTEVAKVGEGLQSVLTVNLSQATAHPGDTVHLSGTLSTADGNAIANGTIMFTLDGQQQPDSTTVTNETGTFESFIEVPRDLAPGGHGVTASFSGSQQLQAASSETALTVEEPAPAAGETEAESAGPKESVETLAPSSPGAAASSGQASGAPAAQATKPDVETPAVITWTIIGGIVLASGTGLALIVVALRPRRRPDPEGDMGLIGDPEEREGEFLGDGGDWETQDAGVGHGRAVTTEVIPLDESASAFAPPVTVRAMPRHGNREPVAARGLVEETVTVRPTDDDGETVDARGPAVPRRAAP
ncbi:Ig-like domain repeat protein [Arachnia propionica]|uniref:Ig-like domain repeat protein n=1 Tax=Arachnia propionica TaxID=1750 RepID=A0A3P1T2I8_9ACTN|nr:Ig-like domain repeat protein [Arachnia propionica]RRD03692.1 Ig-like domain repeat protein [Arachnia propionica]